MPETKILARLLPHAHSYVMSSSQYRCMVRVRDVLLLLNFMICSTYPREGGASSYVNKPLERRSCGAHDCILQIKSAWNQSVFGYYFCREVGKSAFHNAKVMRC